jgi:hypothetical protein
MVFGTQECKTYEFYVLDFSSCCWICHFSTYSGFKYNGATSNICGVILSLCLILFNGG